METKYTTEPIPITRDVLLKIKEAIENPIAIIAPSFYIELGRQRRLSVAYQRCNQFIFVEEYDRNDYRKILDLVCLFNSDYDGDLYLHRLQSIYFSIMDSQLTIKL